MDIDRVGLVCVESTEWGRSPRSFFLFFVWRLKVVQNVIETRGRRERRSSLEDNFLPDIGSCSASLTGFVPPWSFSSRICPPLSFSYKICPPTIILIKKLPIIHNGIKNLVSARISPRARLRWNLLWSQDQPESASYHKVKPTHKTYFLFKEDLT